MPQTCESCRTETEVWGGNKLHTLRQSQYLQEEIWHSSTQVEMDGWKNNMSDRWDMRCVGYRVQQHMTGVQVKGQQGRRAKHLSFLYFMTSFKKSSVWIKWFFGFLSLVTPWFLLLLWWYKFNLCQFCASVSETVSRMTDGLKNVTLSVMRGAARVTDSSLRKHKQTLWKLCLKTQWTSQMSD